MATRGPRARLDEEVDEPVDGGRDGLAPDDLEVRPQGGQRPDLDPGDPQGVVHAEDDRPVIPTPAATAGSTASHALSRSGSTTT